MKWDAKNILFEAEIRLDPKDLEEADEDGLNEAQIIEQAVQNRIGHTGAAVTCVFDQD